MPICSKAIFSVSLLPLNSIITPISTIVRADHHMGIVLLKYFIIHKMKVTHFSHTIFKKTTRFTHIQVDSASLFTSQFTNPIYLFVVVH